MNDIAVVTGYIMYYRMLEDKLNGSFFTQIDKAIEIAEKFTLKYPSDDFWIENNFEDAIYKFVKETL